jgi:hypothetical protein
MIVDVLDETKNDPTPIGNVEIDCSKIFSNPANQDHGKYIYDQWYDLTLMGKRAGMIYLEMTFYPSAPILPPKVMDHHRLIHQEPQEYGPSSDHSHRQLSPHQSHPNVLQSPSPPKKYCESVISPSSSPSKHSPVKDSPSSMKPSIASHGSSYRIGASVLPPKPKPRTAADDIFVSSEASSEKSVFLKRLSLLKNSAGTYESDRASDDMGDSRNSGKKTSKWHKFTSKFQSKDPISTLWQADDEGNDIEQLHYYSNNQQDEIESPPPPPPHLVNNGPTLAQPAPKEKQTSSNKPPLPRKPPPDNTMQRFTELSLTTSIPFSANTIGLNADDLPTQVYLLDKKVKSLTYENKKPVSVATDEIDKKYHAPTPSEHLNQTFRLQSGKANKNDLNIDLRTSETGYLGNGKFSPSIFQRAVQVECGDEENKPKVPPKIPKGLTNQEYYVIAREQYLKDLNGKRM